MPSRRSLLRRSGLALTAGVGLAGCLGDEYGRPTAPSVTSPDASSAPSPVGTGTATGTVEPGEMGDARTIAGLPVVVSNPTAQTSVTHLTTPDSMGVTRAPGGRIVLVDVGVGHDPATPPAGAPSPGEFVLRTGDRSVEGTVSLDDVGSSLRDRRSKYDPGYGTTRGWVAFPVPAPFEAAAARVEVEGSAWRLPKWVVDALGRPLPAWELVSTSLPETLVAGEPFEVSVEVRNTGEVTGRFRGVLNTAGIGAAYAPHPFVLEIEPDESGTWSYRDRAPEADRNVGLYLRTPVGDREVSPEVTVDASSPSSTGEDTPTPQ
jgi:hypothetical protein